jgi:RNA polymerase sigma factor (sigma-70 family)
MGTALVASVSDFLLKQSNRFPLLTPLQEIELGRAIRAWQDHPDGPSAAPERVQRAGKRALDRFVMSNIRLAHKIARGYRDRGVSWDDLTQAAVEGLITAYRKFKPELGYRSSSYAVWYCRLACQQAVSQMGTTIKLPISASDALGRLTRSWEVFSREHGRNPTEAELAEAAGMEVEQLRHLRQLAAMASVFSLDAKGRHPAGDNSDLRSLTCLADVVPAKGDPSEDLHRRECTRRLQRMVEDSDTLGPQERMVINERYLGEDSAPLPRLARLLHVNQAFVAELEARALRTLRTPLEGEASDYLALLAA